jgi:hypothetical protein
MDTIKDKTYWYYCRKCQMVIEYRVNRHGAVSLPSREFMTHRDYISMGYETREAALKALAKANE